MADIFNEIDEDIRRERLAQLWKRYGPYVVAAGIVMLACIGAWRGYEWWEAKKAAEAGSAFEAASALADEGKHDEAAAAFAKLAAEGTSGYRVLARIREAALQAQHDPSAAVAAYDATLLDGYARVYSSERQQLALARQCVDLPLQVRQAIQRNDDDAIGPMNVPSALPSRT